MEIMSIGSSLRYFTVASFYVIAAFSSYPASAGNHDTAYDKLVLSDNPTMYLEMGNAATGSEVDYSGHGLTGTYYEGPLKTADMPNGDKATIFNGLDQYLEVGNSILLSVPNTGVLTIEAWMSPYTLQFPKQEGTSYVHWMGKGTTDEQEYVSRMYSLNCTTPTCENPLRPNRISGYAFNLAGGLGAGSYFQDKTTVKEWIHYVLVINTQKSMKDPTGSTQTYTGYTKIYKDGVLRDEDSLGAPYNIAPKHGTAPFRVGTRDFNSFFEGAIGKVAIYDYELPADRILAHYNQMVVVPSAAPLSAGQQN